MYICLFSRRQAQQALCKSWYCTMVYPLLAKKTEVISALNRDWRRMILHQWVENGADNEMEGEYMWKRPRIGNCGEIAETRINMTTAQPTEGWLLIYEIAKIYRSPLKYSIKLKLRTLKTCMSVVKTNHLLTKKNDCCLSFDWLRVNLIKYSDSTLHRCN